MGTCKHELQQSQEIVESRSNKYIRDYNISFWPLWKEVHKQSGSAAKVTYIHRI